MIIDSKDRFGSKPKETTSPYITSDDDRSIIKKPVSVLSTKNNTKEFKKQNPPLVDTKPSFSPFKWMGFEKIPAIPVLVNSDRLPDPFPPEFDPDTPAVA